MRHTLFIALLLLTAGVDGRGPDIRVVSDFGAPDANVEAVARSAAGALWRHCGEAELAGPGIDLFHRQEGPIALYQRTPEGRVRVGMSSQGTFWAQQAFQFAHEFGHVIAQHTREAGKSPPVGHHPNLWLEESLCETASLFALRAMAREWETAPPYPNWKSYAPSLASYAEERLIQVRRTLPEGSNFPAWLKANELAMRANAVLRDHNLVVASRLLPLFERHPGGWEAVTFLNRHPAANGPRDLRGHLEAWHGACPERHRAFVRELAKVLGIPLS
jgi:hypothetical protein